MDVGEGFDKNSVQDEKVREQVAYDWANTKDECCWFTLVLELTNQDSTLPSFPMDQQLNGKNYAIWRLMMTVVLSRWRR